MSALVSPPPRRQFHRFPLEGSVRVYSGVAMWNTELIDVSLRGALVERPKGFDVSVGACYRLDMRLEGGPIIGMSVTLAHVHESSLGFRCQRIDLDSFLRLKRMIELNLGNTDMLERELEALGSR